LLKKGDSRVLIFENSSEGGKGIITINGCDPALSPLQKYVKVPFPPSASASKSANVGERSQLLSDIPVICSVEEMVTITSCVDEFPCESMAVRVTVFCPRSLQLKLSGATDKVTFPQLSYVPLSISVGSKIAVPEDPSTILKGFVFTTGATLSNTVTWDVQDAELPESSVPIRVTETGEPVSLQSNSVLLRYRNNEEEQLSDEPLLISAGVRVAVPLVLRCKVKFLPVITGGVLSSTVTVALHVALNPSLSVTVRITELTPF
jgi:hypothetical protein